MKLLKQNIRKQITSFEKEIRTYSIYEKIEEQIALAAIEINYQFKNKTLPMLAFCRTKKDDGYANDTLAQVGNDVLDLIISLVGFSNGKSKGEIDKDRQKFGNNKFLFNILKENEWEKFCYHKTHFYNDSPGNNKVSVKGHDSVIEAIIGAIYLDGGFDEVKLWVEEHILIEKTF